MKYQLSNQIKELSNLGNAMFVMQREFFQYCSCKNVSYCFHNYCYVLIRDLLDGKTNSDFKWKSFKKQLQIGIYQLSFFFHLNFELEIMFLHALTSSFLPSLRKFTFFSFPQWAWETSTCLPTKKILTNNYSLVQYILIENPIYSYCWKQLALKICQVLCPKQSFRFSKKSRLQNFW